MGAALKLGLRDTWQGNDINPIQHFVTYFCHVCLKNVTNYPAYGVSVTFSCRDQYKKVITWPKNGPISNVQKAEHLRNSLAKYRSALFQVNPVQKVQNLVI